jgi:small-conductance mechanosensitive channel
MDEFYQFMTKYTGISTVTARKVFISIAVAAAIYLIRIFILRMVRMRKTDDIRLRYRWRKTTLYVGIVLFGFALWRVWLDNVVNITTYLGLLSAGLAVALKEPIENMAGWAFILLKRPFDVGDRIQIGKSKGDVIDQGVFCFTLMEVGEWVDAEQSTGRVLHVPNGSVFNETLANYGAGFQYIWHEIPVLITFESDWRKAEKSLLEIAERHGAELSEKAADKVRDAARKYMIFYQKLTPTVYTTVKDSGVLLTIRLLCEPRKRRNTEQSIWRDILDTFEKEKKINLAYNTMRIYKSG